MENLHEKLTFFVTKWVGLRPFDKQKMVGPQPPYPIGKADKEWCLQLAPAEAGLVVAGLSRGESY
jgi:hypothetical protein